MKDDKVKYSHLKERVNIAFKDFPDVSDEELEQDSDMDDGADEGHTSKNEQEADMDEDDEEGLEQSINQQTNMKEGLDELDDDDDDKEEAGYGDTDEEDLSMAASVVKAEESKDKEEEEKIDNPLIKPAPKKGPTKVSYFLNDLIFEKLSTEKLFEKGDKMQIEKEFNRRFLFRKKIKRELEMRCDLFGLKNCAMVCGKCESIL